MRIHASGNADHHVAEHTEGTGYVDVCRTFVLRYDLHHVDLVYVCGNEEGCQNAAQYVDAEIRGYHRR